MANRRRNRPQNNGGHNNRPQTNRATVFDSNGPDVRIRGTAFQIVDKYMTLAKDAAASGDRVLAENYLQHAEHYQRMVNAWAEEAPPQRNNYRDQNAPQQNTFDDTPERGNTPDTAREPDVVITRPKVVAAAEPNDDDLALPASITGARPSRTAAVAG
jgi:hypothetical protein